jgi:hypothetical protein
VVFVNCDEYLLSLPESASDDVVKQAVLILNEAYSAGFFNGKIHQSGQVLLALNGCRKNLPSKWHITGI